MTSRTMRRLAYLGCSLSVGVFSAFNNFTLALWLSGLTSSYLLISLFGNTRSLEGAFVQPVAGAWSDRTWAGWLGRRRPFILVGGVLSAVLLALTPAIGRLPLPPALGGLPPDASRLVPVLGAVFLFTLTFNVMGDAHSALLADLTEGGERNRLAALSVVANMTGQFGILGLGFVLSRNGVPDAAFAVTGAIMLAGIALTVAGVREPAPAAWAQREAARRRAAGPAERRPTLLRLWADYRGAAYLCLVVFAYWMGVNAVLPLISLYTRDILGASVAEAQLLPALLLLSTTLLAVPMGRLGSRWGKRRTISLGYAIMGLAALGGLVVTTKQQGAVVFFLAGTGNAAAQVLTIPLLADLVPRRHMGLATGALAASGSIAAPLSSLLAGTLADVFGLRAIFAFMAVMVCVALCLLPAVRRPAAGVPDQLLRAPQPA